MIVAPRDNTKPQTMADKYDQETVNSATITPTTSFQENLRRRLVDWLNKRDHYLGKLLSDIHVATGLEPASSGLIFTGTLIVFMIVYPQVAPFLCHVICCGTYPLYGSLFALGTRNSEELKLWAFYWLTYTGISTFDFLVHLTAFYTPIKTAFTVYLFLPPICYIRALYEIWTAPLVELVYGHLDIKTIQKAHPVLLKSLHLKAEMIKSWDQYQLDQHMSRCQGWFAYFLLLLHNFISGPDDPTLSAATPTPPTTPSAIQPQLQIPLD